MREWTDEVLDAADAVGDPPADDVIAAHHEQHGIEAVADLLGTLVENDGIPSDRLPADVIAYLADTASLPSWADDATIARGQELFARFGVPIGLCLFCFSLPRAYMSSHGARVLVGTGRLTHEPRRRILETGQFLVDVLSPGALAPSGGGIRVIQKVRLMHATIRHLMSRHVAEHPELWPTTWGTPINQEELLGTQMSFYGPVHEPFAALGVHIDDDDRAAYLHVWNVIGHVLGIDPDLQPADPAEATRLIATIERRQSDASEDGVVLTKALIEVLDSLDGGRHAEGLNRTMIRRLAGDDVADALQVGPPIRTYGLLSLIKVVTRISSHSAEHDAAIKAIANSLGRSIFDGVVGVERLGAGRPGYFVPPHLLSGTTA